MDSKETDVLTETEYEKRHSQLRLSALAFVRAEINEVHRLLDAEGVPASTIVDTLDNEVALTMSQRVSMYIQEARLNKRLNDATTNGTD